MNETEETPDCPNCETLRQIAIKRDVDSLKAIEMANIYKDRLERLEVIEPAQRDARAIEEARKQMMVERDAYWLQKFKRSEAWHDDAVASFRRRLERMKPLKRKLWEANQELDALYTLLPLLGRK